MATAIEVMAMNLRQTAAESISSHSITTPINRVREAMPIPQNSVDDDPTLARFIRRNVGASTSREPHNSRNARPTTRHDNPISQRTTRHSHPPPKRERESTPPPPMASAPKLQMCFEWLAKGEPATCPSRRGQRCKWDHEWGNASDADKVSVRAHATRGRVSKRATDP